MNGVFKKTKDHTIKFIGGPWDGKSNSHYRDPKQWSAGTDAMQAGMFGLYYTKFVRGKVVTMEWKEMKRRTE